MRVQQTYTEKSFCQAYCAGCCYMQIESRATRKSSCLVSNPHRSVNIAPIFDFVVLFICLSADKTRCYTQAEPKDNNKAEIKILT